MSAVEAFQAYPAQLPTSIEATDENRRAGLLGLPHGLFVWKADPFRVSYGLEPKILYDDCLRPHWAVRTCDMHRELIFEGDEAVMSRIARALERSR